MAWVESVSPSFLARHESEEAGDAARVLELLERAREGLAPLFPHVPDEVAVVLHGSEIALHLAQPYLVLLRVGTAPAARRYLAGWYSSGELHVLSPRRLAKRASSVQGSREMLTLAPAALYARLVIGASNPELPPPFTPRSLLRAARWAWLGEGAAAFFSGQTARSRPAIARRLREGGPPDFPPGLRDATLLGGTVLDLLAREEGVPAAARLASKLHPGGARAALTQAFGGRPIARTESTWRAHLERLAERSNSGPVGRRRRVRSGSAQQLGSEPEDAGEQE